MRTISAALIPPRQFLCDHISSLVLGKTNKYPLLNIASQDSQCLDRATATKIRISVVLEDRHQSRQKIRPRI